MKEVNDPGIKLFGKKIPLPGNANIPVVSGQDSGVVALRELDANRTCFEDDKVNGIEHEEEEVEETEKNYVDEQTEPRSQEKRSHPIREVSKASPESNESPKTSSIDEETAKPENDESDTTNSEQKTLKKPDKILPCPRCNSMDTKFCYYNNYNVNQPRHFCKSCQRYWTAGGVMRNVPVGAGRRRNKNSDLRCHHITISEALHVTPIDAPQRILSFGSDSSLRHGSCVLNLAGENVPTSTQNGLYKLEQGISVSCKVGEYGDNCSSGSSSMTLNSNMEGRKNGVNEPNVQNNHGFPAQVRLLPGVSWSCPWNSAVTVPTIFPMGFPSPYYPTPYWNCNVPCSWGNPWLSPPSPITNQKSSPILGKHSREGDLLKPRIVEEKDPFEQNNTVGSVLVPKTVRIDELDEASKSSIWANLGINNDSISRKGLFKGFQLKKDEKSHAIKSSPVLQANPAALSRSLSFQERA